MKEQQNPRPKPVLIINSSSSSEEGNAGSSGSESSEDEVEVDVKPRIPQYRPPASLAQEKPFWYDPDLEKLLDEAFPMTEEEKAEAGSMLCPTMFFQHMMSAKVAAREGKGPELKEEGTERPKCPYGFGEHTSDKEAASNDAKWSGSAKEKCPHLASKG